MGCETCRNEKEPDNNYCSVPSNVNCCASHGCGMGDYFQKYCKELCGLCDKGSNGGSGGDPVNCEWSDWSWGTCSVTCGGGTQSGSRTVSQEAANGGTDCTGETTATQPCNTESCQDPVNCEWSAWSWGT